MEQPISFEKNKLKYLDDLLNDSKEKEVLDYLVLNDVGFLAMGLFYGYKSCCISDFSKCKKVENNPTSGTGLLICEKCVPEYKKSPEKYLKSLNERRFCPTKFPIDVMDDESNERHDLEFEKIFFKKISNDPLPLLQTTPNASYKFNEILGFPKLYLKYGENKLKKSIDISGFCLSAPSIVMSLIEEITGGECFYYSGHYDYFSHFCRYSHQPEPRIFKKTATGFDESRVVFNTDEILEWIAKYNRPFQEILGQNKRSTKKFKA